MNWIVELFQKLKLSKHFQLISELHFRDFVFDSLLIWLDNG